MSYINFKLSFLLFLLNRFLNLYFFYLLLLLSNNWFYWSFRLFFLDLRWFRRLFCNNFLLYYFSFWLLYNLFRFFRLRLFSNLLSNRFSNFVCLHFSGNWINFSHWFFNFNFLRLRFLAHFWFRLRFNLWFLDLFWLNFFDRLNNLFLRFLFTLLWLNWFNWSFSYHFSSFF